MPHSYFRLPIFMSAIVTRLAPGNRKDYRRFCVITPRWNDIDVFGHINNAEYYAFFDTAILQFLFSIGALTATGGETGVVVAENGCRFHAELVFTDPLQVGLRVAHVGSSSVRYELGIFAGESAAASAEGYFVHVFIDRVSKRPKPIAETVRAHIQELVLQ